MHLLLGAGTHRHIYAQMPTGTDSLANIQTTQLPIRIHERKVSWLKGTGAHTRTHTVLSPACQHLFDQSCFEARRR